jgi:ubiquitin-conjugating enzyme E2 variant
MSGSSSSSSSSGGIPRNFKLLEELDEAEKSSKGGADVSLGLANADDTFLTDWQASIFASAGGGEPRLWLLSLRAGPEYPRVAPSLRFISRVAMDAVDAKGNVLPAKLPYLAGWKPTHSLLGALNEVKALIVRASRAQPPDGQNY